MDKKYQPLAEYFHTVLKQNGMSDTGIAAIEEETDFSVYMHLFLCAFEGMPEEDIIRISEMPCSDMKEKLSNIRKERRKFLAERFGNNIELNRRIEQLIQKVEDVRADAERNIVQITEITDARIHDLQKANEQAERMMSRTLDEKEKQAAEKEKLIRQKDALIGKMKEELKDMRQRFKEMEKCGDGTDGHAGFQADPAKEEMDIPAHPNFKLRKKLSRIWKNDSREFADKYLANGEYSEEQREFLLSCYEKGYSVKEIEKFASSGLSVRLMQRLMVHQMNFRNYD